MILKMVKEALVVRREALFNGKNFQGFISSKEKDFIQIILNNYFYHERGDKLENDDSLQQIIPYVWIINSKTKRVLAYKRSSGKNYSEKRLMDKWSCGIGGHIEREDAENPIMNAMNRELKEEVEMENYPLPKIIGYLNDDADSVGKVHFGVVALAETSENVKKGDDEMSQCQFLSISDLDNLLSNTNVEIESWTRLSWPFVKDYLEKL